MMEPSAPSSADAIREELAKVLGERLIALYRFGGGFGRGPAVKDRLLIILDRIDVKTLDTVSAAVGTGPADGRINLRVLTAESCLRGADAFPAFTLELCNTRELLHGKDVLCDLEVDRRDLRLRLEQSLRRVYRELVQGYLDHNGSPGALAPILRQNVRRLVNLLGGVLYAANVEVPEPPTPGALIEAIDRTILEGQGAPLERMRAMAAYEVAMESEQLSELYGEALQCLADVIAYVDQMD